MDLHSCGSNHVLNCWLDLMSAEKGIAKAQEMHVSPVSMHWSAQFDQLIAESTAAVALLCCPAADSAPSEQLPAALT